MLSDAQTNVRVSKHLARCMAGMAMGKREVVNSGMISITSPLN